MVAHTERNPDTIVTVTTANGDTFEEAFNVAVPLTDLELQWDKLIRKFRALTAPRLGAERAEAIIALCRQLEVHDDLAPLFAALKLSD